MLSHFILFDWSGTLGFPGRRDSFVKNGTAMLPGAKKALLALSKRDDVAGLGLLSNTKTTSAEMKRGLKKSGLDRIFKVQVYSSDENLKCGKPCTDIFQRGWEQIRHVAKDTIHRRSQVLYVGNNYMSDVVGAHRYGFRTALVSNGPDDVVWRFAKLAGLQDLTLKNVAELICVEEL